MNRSRFQQRVESRILGSVNFRKRGLLYLVWNHIVANDHLHFMFTLFQCYVDSSIRYKNNFAGKYFLECKRI